jgi:polar amino acid transport system substrate-binding protein
MKKLLVIAFIAFLAACAPVEEAPLRVGMDLNYPPFETVDGNNIPEGISVDVAKAFGEFLGREVEIVNTGFGALIPALNSGDVDIIIASMSITAARAEVVDFSNPYFYFKIITLANKAYAQANGLTEDTTTEQLLALEDARFVGIVSQVSATIPQSYGKVVSESPDLGTAILSVAQGTSDILLMSAFPVTNGFRANPDTTIVIWDAFVSSPIGMAVRKGDTELLAQANAFIAQMSNPGSTYAVLATKWETEIKSRLGRYGLEFFINE